MKYYVIITNDYEVFGDGTGDTEQILIRPTEELLAICSRFGVPMTLFFDVLEYRAFRHAEDTGVFGKDYVVASNIERQLRVAKGAGHDVQLHMHPQWIGAKPIHPDKWSINPKYYRLPFVPGGLGDCDNPESLRGLFTYGKQLLEGLLKPIDPTYECVAFRAGGYCIQPEKEVLTAMAETGFIFESSVCFGRKANKADRTCDFRGAPPRLPYWRIFDSVTEQNASGLLMEVPVFTSRRTFLALKGLPLVKRIIKSSYVAFRYLFCPVIINFDYCKLSADELRQFLLLAFDKYDGYPGPVPIVITGHSKEYQNGTEISSFLTWASDLEQVEFTSFGGFLERLIEFEKCKSW